LLGGEEYQEVWSKSGAYSSFKTTKLGFTVKFDPSHNGMTILDKRHIKFKENTPYTISGRFNSVKDLHLRFVYSDGTYSGTVLQNYKAYGFYIEGATPSLKDKTVVAIEVYVEGISSTNYTTNNTYFGVYEGAYTKHTDCYEEYNGESFKYYLDAPLMSMGYASDELDLMSGEVTRKIRKETVSSNAKIEGEYSEGVYVIAPDMPMRADSSLYSSLPVLDEADIMTAELGVALTDDGRICVKIPGITGENELISYLEENPFTITYIMNEPIKEVAEGTLPTRDTLSIIDVFCEVLPRKFYAEYV
jgi:hypothetical protein